MWTKISDAAYAAAIPHARGSYQRGILGGYENLSGSTLRGNAKRYGGRYALSRRALLSRLEAAGLIVSEERGPKGRRILTISLPQEVASNA